MSETTKKILVLAATGLVGALTPLVALAAGLGFVFAGMVLAVWFAAAMVWCWAEDRRWRKRNSAAGGTL